MLFMLSVRIAAACLLLSAALPAAIAQEAPKEAVKDAKPAPAEDKVTSGSVTVAGHPIDYQATAGTITVHAKAWDDGVAAKNDKDSPPNPTAEADMFYVAYAKRGVKASERPVTFLFNGGPGSSTVWLHMGAFGPKRVVTSDDQHPAAAPYPFVNNAYSLLDVSDLVFIDAPATGFSRVTGKDKEKEFFGLDADANAFAEFITQFLSKHGRWNSPKYLFGESYGTTRAAALVNILENERNVDFNGVILLSQILNYDNNSDTPQFNPGIDLPYQLELPTFAATAWYHHKLGDQKKELKPLLEEVERFAMTDYGAALSEGNLLDPAKRKAVIEKLHDYTGLSADYIAKSNLRINVGQFIKTLRDESDITVGRLDTRFAGPTLDPLSKEAEYDPQSSAISSSYVSSFNNYVRSELKYGDGKTYKPEADMSAWDFRHQPPGTRDPSLRTGNVMPDLANAMKANPKLKVLLNAGYYDLATPFFEGLFEMRHLPIPEKLKDNIQVQFYESGHMVYAHEPSLKLLHDNVAGFIRSTNNVAP
jgi:carboxypeptidase C (cathepsin A)